MLRVDAIVEAAFLIGSDAHGENLFPQVGVVSTNPIFSNGAEQIDCYGVFKRFHLMRRVRRDLKRLAGVENRLLPGDYEAHTAALQHADLLVHMAVQRNNAAFFNIHGRT